jgi:hypothetical protein
MIFLLVDVISVSFNGPSRSRKSQHMVVVKLSFINIEFINQLPVLKRVAWD